MFDDLKQSKTNISPVDANRAFTICELILYRLRDKATDATEKQAHQDAADGHTRGCPDLAELIMNTMIVQAHILIFYLYAYSAHLSGVMVSAEFSNYTACEQAAKKASSEFSSNLMRSYWICVPK